MKGSACPLLPLVGFLETLGLSDLEYLAVGRSLFLKTLVFPMYFVLTSRTDSNSHDERPVRVARGQQAALT